ncbi:MULTISPECIES: hypothetical protein [Legionella]|uniref:Tryptophan synthase subunit beta like protein n=1 Tax=Legionella septentrionalis TaxID=2498109 RepID=A0A3S0V6E1_9GAMM|nr:MULTISPECIES: hypothetical protein [Legionella]MCP0914123.1 hypothetical protein [Legionella sp. 27cVA30]RUQ90722.1 hypothetical protein EKM59_01220 [Legionella septentrionalis]RUQ99973.1 hypothetical protein ELY11_03785 [Legionella septentrionalis]RUR10182.1 hypothetical protein ELY14_05815 [Legionella septentrionalis]RUR15806.1 hypothetical protein ELY10_05125 [Legionella septentrionalis]
MVFVKRDSQNQICAIFEDQSEEGLEEVTSNDPELTAFLTRCALDKKLYFLKSDLDLIRVIEDLIQILMEKNIIAITDFPAPAIEKLMARQKIRSQFENVAQIIQED